MPRRHFYQALNGQNGALPSRFLIGYQLLHGTYLEVDLNMPEATIRQEIFNFVQRVYQTQVITSILNTLYLSAFTCLCLESICR